MIYKFSPQNYNRIKRISNVIFDSKRLFIALEGNIPKIYIKGEDWDYWDKWQQYLAPF